MADIAVRGIRGATTVAANDPELILAATRELLLRLVEENRLLAEDICSILFTVTGDLNAAFPAAAARQLGWLNVPLMGGCEADVPGSLPRCVRILLHVNTDKRQTEIKHVYLREAKQLRPDL